MPFGLLVLHNLVGGKPGALLTALAATLGVTVLVTLGVRTPRERRRRDAPS